MSHSEHDHPHLSSAAHRVLRFVCDRSGVYRCLEVVPERVAAELGLEVAEAEQALRDLDALGLLHLTGVANLAMVPTRSFKLLLELPEPQPEQPPLRRVS